MRRRDLARSAFGLAFIAAGVLHLALPRQYRAVMPRWLPAPDTLVVVSGVVEIAGGAGLLVTRTRRTAGVGLVLLLIAVLPANVEMLRQHRERGGASWGEALLWLRLPLQGVLIWWAWRLSRPDERGELA
ncbi:MAG: DoxX family protein [Gemmatimonadales bacterium]|nr:DoxX family protein [Gemmatimonadales bacterium]